MRDPDAPPAGALSGPPPASGATGAADPQTEAIAPIRLTGDGLTGEGSARAGIGRHLPALVPGLALVGLFLVWVVHDGGTDRDTWQWGALAVLALMAGCLVAVGDRLALTRASAIAVGLFAAYVGWSFLSITWASDTGAALAGSDLALMYLLVFALLSALPWTARGALMAIVVFAAGVGVIAVVLLTRLAIGTHSADLFIAGRLAAPTGYFNSTGALFNTGALVAISLAARRELPGLLRGALLGMATAGVDLAIVVESRGWLFTLPIVAAAGIVVSRDRLRVTAAAVLPIAGGLVVARRLVKVLNDTGDAPAAHIASHAGKPALVACFAVFVIATIAAWIDGARPVSLSTWTRRAVGTTLLAAGVAGALGVGLVISHGHLGSFVSKQWHGFSHEPTVVAGTHFAQVGSGRYDFWKASLKAFDAHPIGGLGQDNFGDYYLRHRHTTEQPQWTHSLEMRLLAHTGIVGFLLFAGFVVAAIAGALRARRRGPILASALAGTMLLPFLVWLIHGSIDWFWEIPALSGPALGFLGVAGALGRVDRDGVPTPRVRRVDAGARGGRVRTWALGTVAGAAILAAGVAVAFPYLSTREVSIGVDIQNVDPAASLTALHRAGQLNPLDSTAGLIAGGVALRQQRWAVAETSFRQCTSREPGNWVCWTGLGLSLSAQGRTGPARSAYQQAHRIDPIAIATQQALSRVDSRQPLSPADGLRLIGNSN